MESEWVKRGVEIYQAHQPVIALAVGVTAIAGLYALAFFWPRKWERLDVIPKRRGKMLRRDRKVYVESMMLDQFVDDVEMQVYNEVISRAEANEVYRRLRRVFNTNREISPSPRLLKENIRKRMASGINAKVDLPKEEKPQPAVKKPRHMFEKKPQLEPA